MILTVVCPHVYSFIPCQPLHGIPVTRPIIMMIKGGEMDSYFSQVKWIELKFKVVLCLPY